MKGQHEVYVRNRRKVAFRFTLKRNITVVRGNSGTGKTTLYDMIAAHMRNNAGDAVNLTCDKPCMALTDHDWQHQLSGFHDSIVFVDEGAGYLSSEDFASAVRYSDNYYVLFTRVPLHQLPYSVDEIYHIKTSGKYHTLVPAYRQRMGLVYGVSSRSRAPYAILLTEDSKSGLQFFEARLSREGVACLTSSGRSGIYKWLKEHAGQRVFVVADGAAFGPEAKRVLALQEQHPQSIRICLPESFEWLLMKSGVLHDAHIEEVLEDPARFIESREYSSWEQFFTALLRQRTQGTPFEYDKQRLSDAWTVEHNADKVMGAIAHGNVR